MSGISTFARTNRLAVWIATRNLAASHAATMPAVDAQGSAISDHDLLVARFAAQR